MATKVKTTKQRIQSVSERYYVVRIYPHCRPYLVAHPGDGKGPAMFLSKSDAQHFIDNSGWHVDAKPKAIRITIRIPGDE